MVNGFHAAAVALCHCFILVLLRHLRPAIRRRVLEMTNTVFRWSPDVVELMGECTMVWGMDDAGILLSQRTGGGRVAALGTTRERACLPAGSDDREHARGDGA